MSDYEKRLQRLEELARPAEGTCVTREMIEKRNAELFTPEERLAIEAEIAADPEGAKAEVEAILNWAHAEAQKLTAKNKNDS